MKASTLCAALLAATSAVAAPIRPTTVYLSTLYETLQADGDCRTKLTVRVYDQFSLPLSGATVTFYKSSGPAAAHFENESGSTTSTFYTDANGTAYAWYASTEAGASSIHATASKNGFSQNSNTKDIEFVVPNAPVNCWNVLINGPYILFKWPDPTVCAGFSFNQNYFGGYIFQAWAGGPYNPDPLVYSSGLGETQVFYYWGIELDPSQSAVIPGDGFFFRVTAEAQARTDSGCQEPNVEGTVSGPTLYLTDSVNPSAATMLPGQTILKRTHLKTQTFPLWDDVYESNCLVRLNCSAAVRGSDPPKYASSAAAVWLNLSQMQPDGGYDGINFVHIHVESAE